MLSGSGEVEEVEYRGWILWSQVFGVDEDEIQSISRSFGFWIRQIFVFVKIGERDYFF